MQNKFKKIPSDANIKGFLVKSGQSTTATATDENVFTSPFSRTGKNIIDKFNGEKQYYFAQSNQ